MTLKIRLVTALTMISAAQLTSAASPLGQVASIAPGTTETIELSPSSSATISSVLAGMAQWHISPGAAVVLHLQDGIYAMDSTVRIEHPDGARIQIIGNPQAPEKVRLVWPAKMDGIYVGTSAALGRLNGLTLFREIPGGNDNGASDNACGLIAENAGVIQAGPKLVVQGFYYGAQARYGGVIRARGVIVKQAGDAGFFAYNGGHIEAQNSHAENTHDAKLKLGSGYVAEYGGTINASGATSTGNLLAGFSALSGGSIVAHVAKARGNASFSFYAITNGTIVAHGGEASPSGAKASSTAHGGSVTGLDER